MVGEMVVSQVPKLHVCGKTDVGRVRDHNEDTIYWDTDLGLVLLADGMGGHNAGEVASALAVDTVKGFIESVLGPGVSSAGEKDDEALVVAAVSDANESIRRQAGSSPMYAGMGTTIVMAVFHGQTVTLAHVGDSRIYRLRDRALTQMTTDHSLVQELVENGYLTHEEARASTNKNLITRALGIDDSVEVAVRHDTSLSGDVFLFCSDGLTDLVPDEEIHTLLNLNLNVGEGEGELETAVDALVDIANEKGGNDNISVILVRVE